jgi:N-acetylglucosamine kinase-like BadF-type ATPase
MRYFLGADLGGTKTHLVVADENGNVVGFGQAGPGNHQTVGYEGMFSALEQALGRALEKSGITAQELTGACFGIAGYDWPSESPLMEGVLDRLGLSCGYKMVNDAMLPLVAGSTNGWGVGVISGTGCNCCGLAPDLLTEGRMTGYGYLMGEFAGATELVWRAMQFVANEWTRRGPATALTPLMLEHTGAKDLASLLEGYCKGTYWIDAGLTPRIFEVAYQGDAVACDLIRWAGCELGEMAKAVISQLGFQDIQFEVVLAGSMFDGGPMLIDPLTETIQQLAPQAQVVRLKVSPVIGAVVLGMEQGDLKPTSLIRENLAASMPQRTQRDQEEQVG